MHELIDQLTAFLRAETGDTHARASAVEFTQGHAGFSYFFTAHSANGEERFVLRLPPPGVKLEGTADVLRQARVITALHGSRVPVVPVRWYGDDPRWFGRPYFIVPRLEGDTLRAAPGEWGAHLDAATLHHLARQAVTALAELHALDWQTVVPEWGPPVEVEADVTRWDRFWERAADPELVKLGPAVRERLLERQPATPRIGVCHGDFQWTNIFYGGEDRRTLLAVIDWELASVGPVLNDLGWLCTFSDPDNWIHEGRSGAPLPHPEELARLYMEAGGHAAGDLAWHRALAGYKFAIIGGFNLMLHRRGKRHDPHWEDLAVSVPRLLEHALELLEHH
jgi:aminoglycoside phosphotransferase (APT) family kinase protein